MNLRQLEVFQVVLQTGSMSAAARLLCITPSAVSKAVAHTELQLGYRLFNRTPAGLTPTPEAQVLAMESGSIYRQLDALQRTARNLATTELGDVRLAAIPSRMSFAHLAAPACAAAPQVGVEVRTIHQDQMTQALLTRSVDFGLGFLSTRTPGAQRTARQRPPVSGGGAHGVGSRPRAAALAARLAQVPAIRLVGTTPCASPSTAPRSAWAPPAARHPGADLAAGAGAGAAGHGLDGGGLPTAIRLDPALIVAVELHDLPPMSLYSYHASQHRRACTPPACWRCCQHCCTRPCRPGHAHDAADIKTRHRGSGRVAGSALRRQAPVQRRSTRLALVPPKPKLLDSTVFSCASRVCVTRACRPALGRAFPRWPSRR